MHGLKSAFTILCFCGVWMPLTWEINKWLKTTYRFYALFVVSSIYIIISLQFLLLFTSELSLQFFVRMLFTIVTSLSVCAKATTFLLRRKKIIRLADMLRENWCLPRDNEESEMQERADSSVRKWIIILNTMSQLTLLFFFITPLLDNENIRKLPYEIWLPYDLREGSNYWITYFVEILPLCSAILVNATANNIMIGYTTQACNQFDFMAHRTGKFCNTVKINENSAESDENNAQHYQQLFLKEIARQHDYIIKYSRAIQETLSIIFMQIYFGSVLIISVIIYELTMDSSQIVEKIRSVGYLMCMMIEVFVYCWSGNELTLKSSNFGKCIYETDWMNLSKESNRMLKFIMLRTSRPIVMSFYGVINFNIKSYEAILKVAYSAFNLMKEVN